MNSIWEAEVAASVEANHDDKYWTLLMGGFFLLLTRTEARIQTCILLKVPMIMR